MLSKKMKNFKYTSILAISIVLFGCAFSPAKIENMIYHGDKKKYTENLKNNIEILCVLGGEETRLEWGAKINGNDFHKTVRKSLSEQGLLSDKNGEYQLKIRILKIKQPAVGFSATVITYIRYILTNNSNSVVFDETVTSSYTAAVKDAFVGATRLRLATEGSARNNIEIFLKKLSTFKILSRNSIIS